MIQRFATRAQAGQLLAERLMEYAGRPDVVVLAVPRGGVPVAFEVARVLDVELGLVPTRRRALPGCADVALGAVGTGGIEVVNEEAVEGLEVPWAVVQAALADERARLNRGEGRSSPPDLHGRTVILVDDGLATGTTMRAATATVRGLGATYIVLAVPVVDPLACAQLAVHVTEIVCLRAPEPFGAVRDWYQGYPTVTEHDIRALLLANERQREVDASVTDA